MLKLECFVTVVALCISLSHGFFHQPFRQFCTDTSPLTKHSNMFPTVKLSYPRIAKSGGTKVSMSMVAEVGESTPSAVSDGFEKYAVGQEHDGIVVSSKPFGLFVSIAEGVKVLLPRSKMTKGAYEKLKAMGKAKSSETVKIELITISAQNQTLTGQYKPFIDPMLPDFQTVKNLPRKQRNSRAFEATVVSTHDFGLFAELNGYGVEGLIPVSILPEQQSLKSFIPGMQLQVYIGEIKPGDKMTLSLTPAPDATAAGAGAGAAADAKSGKDYANVSPEQWLQGQVQSVTNFGLFVRPADHDLVGMVHLSRIPRELIAVMKQRLQQETPATSTAPAVSVTVGHTDDSSTGNSSKSATTESSAEAADGTAVHEQTSKDTAEGVGAPRVWSNPTTAAIEDATATAAASKKRSSSNKETTSGASADSLTSDLESLFSPGDVVKVRVQSVDLAARRVELSMQPYRQGEKDGKNGSGDGGVRGMQEGEYMVEGRDPEGEESRYEEERRAAEEELALQSRFDPEDTLLWWRAQPYVKTSTLQRVAAMKRGEEEAVMAESSQIVDGTWRRLFELDMRQDAADFSNKGYDAEMKEIADEIGELAGLDEDLYTTGRFDTSDYQNKVKFGAFVDSAIFPAAWRDELDFFQRLEEREKEINEKLRGGKKYDLAEFEAAMRQAQMRATEQTSRMSRGTGSRSSGGSEGSGDGGENVRVWTSTSLSTPSSVVPAEETTVPVSAHNVDEISQGVDSKAVSEPSD